MTAAQIIGEIEELETGEQDQVIRFALTLAQRRRLSAAELGELAAQLPVLADAQAETLKRELERGFYGTAAHA